VQEEGSLTLGTERERSGGGVAQRRSAQAKRGRLGASCRAPGTESLRGLVTLALRGAQKDALFFGWALRAGTGPLWRVAEDAQRLQTGEERSSSL
jgi:hypothetical protein